MPTPIEEFDAQVEILLAGASHERCLCIDARRRRVCGRRCLNGLRHGGVSKPEAIRRRLWCHQCTSRCVPSAILATNIAQLSDAECFKAARQHHVKAEWIPSVIDSSACLQHPNATTSITGRPIKYQVNLISKSGADVLGPVFCNPNLYCDTRKAALKGLIHTVQAMMGFYRTVPGDAMPSVLQVQLWKRALVGFGKCAQWYATVFAQSWCRPLKRLLQGSKQGNGTLAGFIHRFFNEDLYVVLPHVENGARSKQALNQSNVLFLDDARDRKALQMILQQAKSASTMYKRICLMVPSNT